MEPVVRREITRKGMQTSDIILVGALLAAGAVLRLITPSFFGITPNFAILMYCLAIYLIRPRFGEVVGISIVAAAICHFTSKSAVPYINFISEPIGALVAFGLVLAPFKVKLGSFSFKPALVTLFGTLASGLVYISTLKLVLLFRGAAGGKAYTALLLVVVTTAIANTVIAQLIYYPIKAALGKKDLAYD